METSMRRKATLGLLAVTFAWGATFIWMKQAMNAIQPQIEAYGRTPVVAALVGGRFLIAFIALFVISKEARTALKEPTIVERGCNFRRDFACWLHHPNDWSRFDYTLNFRLFDIALCRIHSTDYDQIDRPTRPSNNDSRRCPCNLWRWLHRRPTSSYHGALEKFSPSSVPFSSLFTFFSRKKSRKK